MRNSEDTDTHFPEFDPENPNAFISLLRSSDPFVRRRALFVFGELGRKGCILLDAALESVKHPVAAARIGLMNGVISYSRKLDAQQTALVLELADDVEDLVRTRVIAFLGAADLQVIRSAIGLLSAPLRAECDKAFQIFDADPASAQVLFDGAAESGGNASTFTLAALERMARDGRLTTPLKYSGSQFLAESVLANIHRLARRAAR